MQHRNFSETELLGYLQPAKVGMHRLSSYQVKKSHNVPGPLGQGLRMQETFSCSGYGALVARGMVLKTAEASHLSFLLKFGK